VDKIPILAAVYMENASKIDVNYSKKTILYQLDIKDVLITNLVIMGQNVLFENVANSSKLHLRIADIALSLNVDMSMTGLYIIPLSLG